MWQIIFFLVLFPSSSYSFTNKNTDPQAAEASEPAPAQQPATALQSATAQESATVAESATALESATVQESSTTQQPATALNSATAPDSSTVPESATALESVTGLQSATGLQSVTAPESATAPEPATASKSAITSESPTTSESATAPAEEPQNKEAPQQQKKQQQLNISTDDFYMHNPKMFQTPLKIENLSKALAKYPTVKSQDSIDDDIRLDKVKSFSTSISGRTLGDSDDDTEPVSQKLDRFTRSLSKSSSRSSLPRSPPKDAELRKFGSFSRSLSTKSLGFSTDDNDSESDLDSDIDDEESLPSRSLPKSSVISTITDKGTELGTNMYSIPKVIGDTKSFLAKPKALSAEDKNEYAAAINHNFWLTFKRQVYTASVTPYRKVRPPKRDIRPILIKGYKMVRMVTILRHSIRLPTADTIVEMKKILPDLQRKLRQAAHRHILWPTDYYFSPEMENWTMYDELAEHGVEMKKLVRQGRKEARRLGKRFRRVFKHLLPEKFDKKHFIVKFTDCPRTKDTALNFMDGLYEKENLMEKDDWYEEVKSKESVLKYDSTCDVWKSWKKSDFNKYLSKSFLNGPYMKETAANVAVRVGLEVNQFSVDDLILVYETCGFEVAWRKISPWCDLLTETHMKVLEYAADLELFIIAGYANVMNTKIPCKLYNDLMNHLKNGEELKALFYVTHLTSILKFLTFLGLYQDIDIRLIKHRPEYNPDVEERNWRTAYLGAFTTNITFVLFEDEKKKLWIQVRHQERPVFIAMCPLNSELLCPLETFEIIFERWSYGNCQFEEWCNKDKIYPKEKNKYFNRSYSVGERRIRLLEEEEMEKKAKKNKGTGDTEQEIDYRRTKSTGRVKPPKDFKLKKSLTTAKDELSHEEGQRLKRGKETDTDEGEVLAEEEKEVHTTTEGESFQEMEVKEETDLEDLSPTSEAIRTRSSHFWSEFAN